MDPMFFHFKLRSHVIQWNNNLVCASSGVFITEYKKHVFKIECLNVYSVDHVGVTLTLVGHRRSRGQAAMLDCLSETVKSKTTRFQEWLNRGTLFLLLVSRGRSVELVTPTVTGPFSKSCVFRGFESRCHGNKVPKWFLLIKLKICQYFSEN